MADLTSVGVTSGIPSSGTGTVGTINYLTQVGAPISNGSTSAPVIAAVTGTASAVTSTMSAVVMSISPNGRTVTLSSNPTVIPSSQQTVTLSSNPTVIPSSAIQVTLTSNTVTLSSNPTVIPSSAYTVSLTTASGANTVTLSSAINATTVISSALSVTPTSAIVVTLSTAAGANTVTLSSAINATATFSSGTFTLSSNPTVILSSNPTVILSSNPTVLGSSQVAIIGGTGGANTANVLAGSSTVTSTMASLVVALSSNGAGIIGTGTPTAPSSQYISAVVVGDLAYGGSNSSASNPQAIGGTYFSTQPTAVTSGQRTTLWTDKVGRPITVSTLRVLKGVTLTSVSSTTTETNITPASSGGLFLDLYGLVIANQSSINAQTVTIKDSSGGTSRMIFQVPANDTRGFMVAADSAMLQAATSQAWTATNSNSSGTVQVTAMYVSNA